MLPIQITPRTPRNNEEGQTDTAWQFARPPRFFASVARRTSRTDCLPPVLPDNAPPPSKAVGQQNSGARPPPLDAIERYHNFSLRNPDALCDVVHTTED